MEFPRNISIYTFYTISNRMRRSGESVVTKGMGGPSVSMHAFSELTFPPFGFVMTFNNQAPIEQGFCEISAFANFRYADWRAGITMRLPVMPIYTGFPGDYRNRDQTMADYTRNKAAEAAMAAR